MSKEIKIQENQTLLDIAVQKYGNADGVFDLLRLNEDLSLDKQLTSGQEINYEVIADDKAAYMSNKNVATDASDELSTLNWILENGCWNDEGCWIDERYWQDQCDRHFLEDGWWDDGKIWGDGGVWADYNGRWISESGFWDDGNVWIDTETWND